MNLKNKKLFSLNKFLKILKKLKKENKKIIFTNGCFDIIHSGHIKILEESKRLGDILILGLNTDSSIKKIKGPKRPINNLKDRAYVLSAISYIDYIIPFSDETPLELIKNIKPDFLVKGGDYKESEVIGREYAKKVIIISLLKGHSTTKIIEKSSNK